MKRVGAAKAFLKSLRAEIERDLLGFDKDLKSMRRGLFRQKSLIQRGLLKEQKAATMEIETLCKDSDYGFCRVSTLRLLHALSDRHRLNLIEQRHGPYADPTVLFYSLLNTVPFVVVS